VVVKGDASIQNDKVIEVLDAMRRLNIGQLRLATNRLVK